MQFQSDIIGCSLFRSTEHGMSTLGAVYLAGLAIGFWNSEEDIGNLPRECDCFKPNLSAEKRSKLYDGWVKAVNRAVKDFDKEI